MTAEARIDRRQMLKGAGAVGVGTLAALVPASALADDDHTGGLLGTWHAPHTTETGPFASPTPVDGYITFGPGGVLIAMDTISPDGLGNWAKHDEDGFRFTFHSFVVNPQIPPGSSFQGTRVPIEPL